MPELSPENLQDLMILLRDRSVPTLSDDQMKQAITESSGFGQWSVYLGHTFHFRVEDKFFSDIASEASFRLHAGKRNVPSLLLRTHSYDKPSNVCGIGWGNKHYFRHHLIDNLKVGDYEGKPALRIGLSAIRAALIATRLFGTQISIPSPRGVALEPRTYSTYGGRQFEYDSHEIDTYYTGDNGGPQQLVRAQEIVIQADGRGLVVNR